MCSLSVQMMLTPCLFSPSVVLDPSSRLQGTVNAFEHVTDSELMMLKFRLRLTDVKAEHFERKVQSVEAERDNWEKKYEEAVAKYEKAKSELDELAASLENL